MKLTFTPVDPKTLTFIEATRSSQYDDLIVALAKLKIGAAIKLENPGDEDARGLSATIRAVINRRFAGHETIKPTAFSVEILQDNSGVAILRHDSKTAEAAWATRAAATAKRQATMQQNGTRTGRRAEG